MWLLVVWILLCNCAVSGIGRGSLFGPKVGPQAWLGQLKFSAFLVVLGGLVVVCVCTEYVWCLGAFDSFTGPCKCTAGGITAKAVLCCQRANPRLSESLTRCCSWLRLFFFFLPHPFDGDGGELVFSSIVNLQNSFTPFGGLFSSFTTKLGQA